MLGVRFPLMPFVADDIVTVEDSHAVHVGILPARSGMGYGFGEYEG